MTLEAYGRISRAFLLLAFAMAGGREVCSQDTGPWEQALAAYHRFASSKEAALRALAAEELARATSPKWDRSCWAMVLSLLRQELARAGKDGGAEEKISPAVLEGCLTAFCRLSEPAVVSEMSRLARSRSESDRVRAYVTWALGPQADVPLLKALLSDSSPLVQVAAARAIARRECGALAPDVIPLLRQKRPWEFKHAALEALERMDLPRSGVDALVEAMGQSRPGEEGLKRRYAKTLRRLTGLDLESDVAEIWKDALPGGEAGRPNPARKAPGNEVSFCGLRSRSTRIVFLVDCSESMSARLERSRPPPVNLDPGPAMEKDASPASVQAREEVRRIWKGLAGREASTRLEAAQGCLADAVYRLSPQTCFTVIWFSTAACPWKKDLVQATWENKLECLRHAERVKASGVTNFWDALKIGLQAMPEQEPRVRTLPPVEREAGYAMSLGGPDTLFLLSDGRPNEGALASAGEILSEIRKVRHWRPITLHTAAIGERLAGVMRDNLDNPDPDFLRALAGLTGGGFVHLK